MFHRNTGDDSRDTWVKASEITVTLEKRDGDEGAGFAARPDAGVNPSAPPPRLAPRPQSYAQVGGAASVNALHQSAQSQYAKQEEPFLMALVDGDAARRNGLRQRLDALGHASLAFDSPKDLLAALRAGRQFGCVMVALQDDALLSQLETVLSVSRAPLLLVSLDENLAALSDIGRLLLGSGNVDVVPLSCGDREMEWRLQLLMQRKPAGQMTGDELTWGPYRFETRRRIAWFNERRVSLKPLEFELAVELFKHMNFMVTRERLYAVLWGDAPNAPKSRKLDVCVSNVRRKLELGPDGGFLLRSIYRRGYELNALAPHTQGNAQAPL